MHMKEGEEGGPNADAYAETTPSRSPQHLLAHGGLATAFFTSG
jgi:hypothetical protein